MPEATDSAVPSSVDAIIDLYRDNDLLEELGLSPNHAGTMKTRGRIPSHWHVKFVEVAQRHSLPVTYETLAKLAEKAADPSSSEVRNGSAVKQGVGA